MCRWFSFHFLYCLYHYHSSKKINVPIKRKGGPGGQLREEVDLMLSLMAWTWNEWWMDSTYLLSLSPTSCCLYFPRLHPLIWASILCTFSCVPWPLGPVVPEVSKISIPGLHYTQAFPDSSATFAFLTLRDVLFISSSEAYIPAS